MDIASNERSARAWGLALATFAVVLGAPAVGLLPWGWGCGLALACVLPPLVASGARARRWPRGMLAALLATALACLLPDLVLRALERHPGVFRSHEALIQYWARDPRLLRYRREVTVELTAYGDLAAMTGEPELRQPREMRFETDAHGFRRTLGAGGRPSVILLGDSVAAGSGTTAGEACADLLATKYGHTLANLSVGAHNAWQEYVTLRYEAERLELGPDQTVLWLLFAVNDLEGEFGAVGAELELAQTSFLRESWRRYDSWRTHSPIAYLFQRPDGGKLPRVMRKVLPDGETMLFFNDYAQHLGVRPDQVTLHSIWPQVDVTLAGMAELARTTGVRVVVCLAPSKGEVYRWVVYDGEPFDEPPQPAAVARELARRAQAAGLEVHDFTQAVTEAAMEAWKRGELLYWRDDTHPNPRGHVVLARLLDAVL